MKKFYLLFVLVFALSGCAYINGDPNQEVNAVNQSAQMCKELKRNLIFNSTSSLNMGAASATQRAQMNRLYQKYNCGKLEK